MKKYTFLVLFFLLFSKAYSQDLKFTSSEPFEEAKIWTKLMFLSNGNTLMIHMTNKTQFTVRIYDTNGKEIKSSIITLSTVQSKDLLNIEVKGLYQMDNEIVLFCTAFPENIFTLYRVRIDATTGALIKEEMIANMPKLKSTAGYAMEAGVARPKFFVEKDPESNYYGVVVFNSFAPETERRIEVIHFSPDHKEINRAFYPNADFKYTVATGIFVKSSEYIMLSAYAYNTTATGGDKTMYYFSKLKSGSKEYSTKSFECLEYSKTMECRSVYSPKENKLFYFLVIQSEKDKHPQFRTIVHPYNLLTEEYSPLFDIPSTNIFEASYPKGKRPKENYDLLHNVVLDPKLGNLILLIQETERVPGASLPETLYYGNMMILTIDGNGASKAPAQSIPYSGYVYGWSRTSFSHFDIQNNKKIATTFLYPSNERPWDYFVQILPAKTNNYVFCNMTANDFESAGNINGHGMPEFRKMESVYYKMTSGGVMSKGYTLKKNFPSKDYDVVYHNSFAYDPSTGRYATIKVNKTGKVETASIIWTILE